jgi:hypothetical protein
VSQGSIAGRDYFRVYSLSGRQDLHEAVTRAIEASGGRVLYSSPHTRAPFYFGVQTDQGERLGLLVYPARFVKRATEGRAEDENRGQLRFGSEESWANEEHPIAFDVAGVDITMLLGIDPERDIFIGLDPRLWSPMPLGISFYAKDAELNAMGSIDWHTWEKDNAAGVRRTARSDSGLEAVTAFSANRFLDYARFERVATDLGLDTPLRLKAAVQYSNHPSTDPKPSALHLLETQFDLSSREILDIIGGRSRLQVAVRGGVAEHHLEKLLEHDAGVRAISRRDRDAEPDFDVELVDGRTFVIECKNVSPNRYRSGEIKVEVQKTRASKNDPASRYYRVDEFDVVAACLFSATGKWEFRYALSASLDRHNEYPDRLAPMQRIDSRWVASIHDLPAQP